MTELFNLLLNEINDLSENAPDFYIVCRTEKCKVLGPPVASHLYLFHQCDDLRNGVRLEFRGNHLFQIASAGRKQHFNAFVSIAAVHGPQSKYSSTSCFRRESL